MTVILFTKRGVEERLYHNPLSFYFSEEKRGNLELDPNGTEERQVKAEPRIRFQNLWQTRFHSGP